MARPKTKTQSQAIWEYKQRNYDRVSILMPKGAKERIKALATADGVSVSKYIMSAVEEKSGLKLTLDNALPWMKQTDEGAG